MSKLLDAERRPKDTLLAPQKEPAARSLVTRRTKSLPFSPKKLMNTKHLGPSLLLGSALCLLFEPSANACSCGRSQLPRYEMMDASAVFLGDAVSRREVHARFGGMWEVEFDVAQVWKGPSRKTIRVRTQMYGTACGYPFEIGETYLVFAYGSRLSTSSCSPTTTYYPGFLTMGELPEAQWKNTDYVLSSENEALRKAFRRGGEQGLMDALFEREQKRALERAAQRKASEEAGGRKRSAPRTASQKGVHSGLGRAELRLREVRDLIERGGDLDALGNHGQASLVRLLGKEISSLCVF